MTGRPRRCDEGFIPLVDEVRLKRPDLYGLSSYNLYGSARLEGSRSTPLATPVSGRRRRSAPWEVRGGGCFWALVSVSVLM